MDLEQLTKRVQWIEEERRKEREAISILENRLLAMEGGIDGLNQQLKEIESLISRFATVVTRMDQFDAALAQVRVESKQEVDELEKEFFRRQDETEKVRRVEMTSLEISLVELKKEIEVFARFERNLQIRSEEDARLRQMIEETQQKIISLKRDEEEYTRTYRLLEDGRRQDSKRIIDLQGEVSAMRKRVDEQRGQSDLVQNSIRKLDTRLNELVAVEAERRDTIASFMDKQAISQVERDRIWREWESRFNSIEQQSSDVNAKLLTLDATQREAKRAQGILDELAGRVERRIVEITEIQRLAEDRFRQEWANFKADDQKRWANYTLTQEEQEGETLRQIEKLTDRSTYLEDAFHDLDDLVQKTNEDEGARLQSLLALIHEWTSSFERLVGRSR
jgi:chromosome segregation ATPase